MGTTRPNTEGGAIAVTDSDALALLNAHGLPPGTKVFNADVGHMFRLTTSTAALDPDVVIEVLGITGARWILDTSDAEVAAVVAGTGISVDNTDPQNPVVSNDGLITVVAGDGITIDDSDPQNPVVTATAASTPTVQFELPLSYGQDAGTNDDLPAGDSFWFQPQTVGPSPLADEVREWPTSRDLTFVGLTVFVNAATINVVALGADPRFIITVDGADTGFEAVLTAGAHTDEILETSGYVSIPANSRIGVRFSGEDVDAASTLRCEMMTEGASTAVPAPPPAIPTSGLLLDLASENYVAVDAGGSSTGDWSDDSGNSNDFATGGTLFSHVPVLEPAAFNADAGVTWSRVNSFGMTKTTPTWYAANAARTMAMVVRGDDISLGTLFHVRASTVASHDYQLSEASLPQIIWINNAANISNTTPFFDLNTNKAVLMWWTTGTIGDPLFFSVNGVMGTLDDTMAAEGLVSFLEIGYDEGVYPDSERADCSFARILTWNRVLTISERNGVLGNLTARYL